MENIDFIFRFLTTGWDTAIGLLIGLIGIVASFLIYFWTRRRKVLVYSQTGERLLGLDGQLPSDVTVQFHGQNIPRLTRTVVVIWNAGEETILGEDIVGANPLRLVFKEKVLSSTILKVSRPVIKFTCDQEQQKVDLNFLFLDTGDGAVIEILHTSDSQKVEIFGTIRGIPKGIYNGGRINKWPELILPFPLREAGFNRNAVVFPVVSCVVGVITMVVGLSINNNDLIQFNYVLRSAVFFGGFLYFIIGMFILWKTRRRYPRSLHIEQLE